MDGTCEEKVQDLALVLLFLLALSKVVSNRISIIIMMTSFQSYLLEAAAKLYPYIIKLNNYTRAFPAQTCQTDGG